jgi:hypothetical protein
MSDPAAFELLHHLAALQRRNAGGIILLNASRSHAHVAEREHDRVAIDPAKLRELQQHGLIMVEPYREARPRGTQVLGMTSKGWSALPRDVGVPGR